MRYATQNAPRARRSWIIPAACAVVALYGVAATAEPPHTSFIFPAGGQRGTQVEVRVGGCYLHEEAPFHLRGDGVDASPTIRRAPHTVWFEGPLVYPPESSRKEDYPQDYLGTITIDADAPPGVRYWRSSTSQGVTAARKFVVGDLPEVVEQEIDGEPIPMEVTLPVTVNGRIFPRRDIDVWSFRAAAGRRVRCTVDAAGLGSPLDARIEVRGPAGNMVAESSGRTSLDPRLNFETPAAGRYEVRIHDAAFGGLQDYVYRLTITDGPSLEGVFPLGGRRGQSLELRLEGQNLSTRNATLAIPADAAPLTALPLSYDGRVTQVVLETGEAPETLEDEPNNTRQSAPLVPTPVTLNGRIDQAGDVDVWAVEMAKGDKLQFDVHAARLGSPLDSLLVVRSETGDELARNDDASGGQPDSLISYTAKTDGPVYVEISERFARRGGPSFAYRLHVSPPTPPGFDIVLPADAVTVDRGGQVKLQLTLSAQPGFNRPIKISVEGLPAGVTAAEVQAKKAGGRVNLTIEAADSAALGATPIRIVGVTTDDQPPVSTVARVAAAAGELPREETLLAVAEPTPFTFAAEYAFSFVPRGSVQYKHYKIERNGYEGPLEVRLADRQIRHLQGVQGTKIVVPAEASEFDYPIYLPPWMELGRTSRTTLMATGVVTGADGKQHRVVYTSGSQNDQIICRVSPARLLVEAPTAVEVKPGGGAAIPFTLKRDGSLAGDARVELIAPAHVAGVAADPIVLPEAEERGELIVQFGASPGPLNMPLLLRASCGEGDQRVVGEAEIELFRAE